MIPNAFESKLIRMSRELFHVPVGPHKHFSYIVHKNNILSVGFNNTQKTHPFACKFKHPYNTIHSELNAIKKMRYPLEILEDCSIYNVRLGQSKHVRLSKPCEKCYNMLMYFNINKIFYTDNDGQFYSMRCHHD